VSEHLRYLLTVDAKTGALVKTEQLGEAGDLWEVDLAAFTRSLASSLSAHGSLGAPSQVVINVYSGAAPGAGSTGGSTGSISAAKDASPGPPGPTIGSYSGAPPPPKHPRPRRKR
jgi:hypothetical protein